MFKIYSQSYLDDSQMLQCMEIRGIFDNYDRDGTVTVHKINKTLDNWVQMMLP